MLSSMKLSQTCSAKSDMFGKVSKVMLEPERKLNNDLHFVHDPSLSELEHQRGIARLVYIKNWSENQIEAK